MAKKGKAQVEAQIEAKTQVEVMEETTISQKEEEDVAEILMMVNPLNPDEECCLHGGHPWCRCIYNL